MEKKKILIQIDPDQQPSVFDRVVAVDAGADEIFTCGSVRLEQLQSIVHGAIFTRGPDDLKNTAIFIGGSDMAAGEIYLAEVRKHMLPQFGLQCSVMYDCNGSNTTAAAAVHCVAKHMDLSTTTALILGGTGPVGQRVARLLARSHADVRIGSRQRERAEGVAAAIRNVMPTARVTAVAVATAADGPKALVGCSLVVAAGAAGNVLLPKKIREGCKSLKVAVDLNAVPPTGIEGLEPADKATEREGIVCYGALGVGVTKMKLHKAAIAALFSKNDLVLDAEQLFEMARDL